MARFLTFCLALLISITSIHAQVPETPTSLQVGVAIERPLGPGQSHVFEIKVDEPSYMQLVVEQKGIDVIIRVLGPDGNLVGEYDSPNGSTGPENVIALGPSAGVYRITVTPLDQDRADNEGRYEIKLQELRAATEDELKSLKNAEKLKEKGRELLSDVEAAIPQIHSAENRIRLQLQLAKLLLPTDQKRGLKVLGDAINGLKELLTAIQSADDDNAVEAMNAKQLRIEVFQIVSAQDPEMALNFMRSTRSLIRADYGRQNLRNEETTMEVVLANQIAAADPKRAMQLAEENLKTGYSSSLIQTVQRLRTKAPDLSSKLTRQIVDKLLNDQVLRNTEAIDLSMLLLQSSRPQLRSTSSSRPAENALLEDADRKALLQKLLSEVSNFNGSDSSASRERVGIVQMLQGLKSFSAEIESVLPGGAAIIDKKLATFVARPDPQFAAAEQYRQSINSASVDTAVESVAKAPQEIREQLYIEIANRAAASGDLAKAKQILDDGVGNSYQRQQMIYMMEQQALSVLVMKGKFDEATRILSARKPSQERTVMISQLAGQVAPGFKKNSALSFLEQLKALMGPSVQAENQESLSALLELSRAFSHYDTNRAFEIIGPLVDQFNEMSVAAKTLDGFGQKYYEDNELMLQNGNAVGSVAVQMSIAIGTLAQSNFERARETADKIRLPEIKILAYLQIAQQVMIVK
jgi:hypothetical protein